ncbi:HAD-IA family hydrolase [Streptomyces triticirhizae]|uniref:HAD family hydrolase n=1 Tax=Streptomyces triticirhizae TaxID=2483353 RepID=A0A3M2LZU9_9ACTN|nr:HAD-IA family hydrolase [Streptomyces triticirhizae]RMI40478.1 HAD family hydrolase [Streptomyces triticirhizae]
MTTGLPFLGAKALLLDVDGVLIDSAAPHRRVWSAWAVLRGLDPEAVWAASQGRRRPDVLALVAPELAFPEEDALLTELSLAEEHTLSAFPGAVEVLRTLPIDRWAVVTSGGGAAVRRRMARLGLPAPPVHVCANDVTAGKPDPEGYLRAAAALGTPPGDCLVVEDSPAGVAAGKAAGCTVHALTTTHAAEELAAADGLFDSLGLALAGRFGPVQRRSPD